jgi:hypothetical protein
MFGLKTIARNDIKYAINASFTLKHDHYTGFFEYCKKKNHQAKNFNIIMKKMNNIKKKTAKPLMMTF